MIAVTVSRLDDERVAVFCENHTVAWGSLTDHTHVSEKTKADSASSGNDPKNTRKLHSLIPDLLEDRWVIVDVPHLNDDCGGGVHPQHAQGVYYQEVGCRLLQEAF